MNGRYLDPDEFVEAWQGRAQDWERYWALCERLIQHTLGRWNQVVIAKYGDDLLQEGRLAAWSATESFDPTRGDLFAFATTAIYRRQSWLLRKEASQWKIARDLHSIRS